MHSQKKSILRPLKKGPRLPVFLDSTFLIGTPGVRNINTNYKTGHTNKVRFIRTSPTCANAKVSHTNSFCIRIQARLLNTAKQVDGQSDRPLRQYTLPENIICSPISYGLKRHLEDLVGSRLSTNQRATFVLCPYMARAVNWRGGKEAWKSPFQIQGCQASSTVSLLPSYFPKNQFFVPIIPQAKNTLI